MMQPRAGHTRRLALFLLSGLPFVWGCTRIGFSSPERPADGADLTADGADLTADGAGEGFPGAVEGGLPGDALSEGIKLDNNAPDQRVPWSPLWSTRFGPGAYDLGFAVAVDAAGRVYLTGEFSDQVDFGAGPLLAAGSVDVFLAVLQPSGGHVSSIALGGSQNDYGRAVAVDSQGNSYVAGHFQGTASFGQDTLVSAGSWDLFVASFAPDGTHRFSRSFGGPLEDLLHDLVLDASGNVYLTGSIQGTVDLGGGALSGAEDADTFLLSLSSTGSFRFAKRLGGPGRDEANSVALDASGNIYLAGLFYETASFGGATLTATGGGADMFLASFDASGLHRFSLQGGGTQAEYGWALAVDGLGRSVVTGSFQGQAGFGGTPLNSAGGRDVFVAGYDSSGGHLFSAGFGGGGDDEAWGVALDASGNIYVTGRFEGNATFGSDTLSSAGDADVFVLGLDNTGAHRFSRRFGGAGSDRGIGIAAGTSGLWVTGSFEGTAEFGEILTSQGRDGFLLRLAL